MQMSGFYLSIDTEKLCINISDFQLKFILLIYTNIFFGIATKVPKTTILAIYWNNIWTERLICIDMQYAIM